MKAVEEMDTYLASSRNRLTKCSCIHVQIVNVRTHYFLRCSYSSKDTEDKTVVMSLESSMGQTYFFGSGQSVSYASHGKNRAL